MYQEQMSSILEELKSEMMILMESLRFTSSVLLRISSLSATGMKLTLEKAQEDIQETIRRGRELYEKLQVWYGIATTYYQAARLKGALAWLEIRANLEKVKALSKRAKREIRILKIELQTAAEAFQDTARDWIRYTKTTALAVRQWSRNKMAQDIETWDRVMRWWLGQA